MSYSPCWRLWELGPLLTFPLGRGLMRIVGREGLMMRKWGGRGVAVGVGWTWAGRDQWEDQAIALCTLDRL